LDYQSKVLTNSEKAYINNKTPKKEKVKQLKNFKKIKKN